MKNIKILRVLTGLVVWALITLFALPASAGNCHGGSKNSSKDLCMGVSGWKLGRNCPNIELYWQYNHEGKGGVFFKNSSGAVVPIAEGMATFSPACDYFWRVSYRSEIEWIERIEEPNVNKKPRKVQLKMHVKKATFDLFSTETSKLILKVEGEYPGWSPDGKVIYFFRTGKSGRQLWELNVASKNESMIFEAQDYFPCEAQGDGVEWTPVIITKEENILWWYLLKPTDAPMPTSAKKLYIDHKTRKIIRVDSTESCPCFPEEK